MELLIQAVLDRIQSEMERLLYNKYQRVIDTPFSNSGNQYSNRVFAVRAYCWNDDEDECKKPNFEYKDFACWWYKYSHRGLNWKYKNIDNGIVPSDFLAEMLEDCCRSMDIDNNL